MDEFKIVLMSSKNPRLRRLLKVFFGQTGYHIGIFYKSRCYHLAYGKGLRVTKIQNVLKGHFVMEMFDVPSEIHPNDLDAAVNELKHRVYNKPLFFFMFVRQFVKHNFGFGLPSWFYDPDKAMCADIVTYLFDQKLLSHQLTPETAFLTYAKRPQLQY